MATKRLLAFSFMVNYRNWKAAHYQAKRSMDEIGVFGLIKDDTIEVSLVSDSPKDIVGCPINLTKPTFNVPTLIYS